MHQVADDSVVLKVFFRLILRDLWPTLRLTLVGLGLAAYGMALLHLPEWLRPMLAANGYRGDAILLSSVISVVAGPILICLFATPHWLRRLWSEARVVVGKATPRPLSRPT